MIDISLFFVILGTAFYTIGFVPYIYHTFHGRVVPHPFSWTIWCILSGINTLVLLSRSGVDVTLITPVMRTFALLVGSIIGWILIRRIAISIFDYICLVLAIICIGIAYIYGVNNAVIPTVLVDFLVLSPTIKKIWKDPKSEDIFAWVCVVFSQSCIVLSFDEHTLVNSLYWSYQIIANASIALLIYRRRLYVSSFAFYLSRLR